MGAGGGELPDGATRRVAGGGKVRAAGATSTYLRAADAAADAVGAADADFCGAAAGGAGGVK